MSRILGHASIATTADVYGHLTDTMLGRAAERTDTVLGHGRASETVRVVRRVGQPQNGDPRRQPPRVISHERVARPEGFEPPTA